MPSIIMIVVGSAKDAADKCKHKTHKALVVAGDIVSGGSTQTSTTRSVGTCGIPSQQTPYQTGSYAREAKTSEKRYDILKKSEPR